jgi:hypothetical protein
VDLPTRTFSRYFLDYLRLKIDFSKCLACFHNVFGKKKNELRMSVLAKKMKP